VSRTLGGAAQSYGAPNRYQSSVESSRQTVEPSKNVKDGHGSGNRKAFVFLMAPQAFDGLEESRVNLTKDRVRLESPISGQPPVQCPIPTPQIGLCDVDVRRSQYKRVLPTTSPDRRNAPNHGNQNQ